jgi:hypothetical protein
LAYFASRWYNYFGAEYEKANGKTHCTGRYHSDTFRVFGGMGGFMPVNPVALWVKIIVRQYPSR